MSWRWPCSGRRRVVPGAGPHGGTGINGNPLFIDELVRHIQSGEPTERWEDIGQLDLDEVLWERIEWQPEEARRLLGIVAISGRPIRQAVAFQASELGVGGRVAMASLRSARLIRCIGQTQHNEIEVYHDRIRETVIAHLSPDVLKATHHDRMARVRRHQVRWMRKFLRDTIGVPAIPSRLRVYSRCRPGGDGARVRSRRAALPDCRGA